jgi:hypothetical protein
MGASVMTRPIRWFLIVVLSLSAAGIAVNVRPYKYHSAERSPLEAVLSGPPMKLRGVQVWVHP